MIHVSIEDIAKANRITKRGAQYRARTQRWPYGLVSCRGGKRRLYPLSSLPMWTRDAVILWMLDTL